jgi:hypothetical protein
VVGRQEDPPAWNVRPRDLRSDRRRVPERRIP